MTEFEVLLNQLNSSSIEYIPLCQCTKLVAGDRITKAMMSVDFEYPVMGGGTSPSGFYSSFNFENSIAISRAGSAGYVNWMEDKFWATDVCFVASQLKDGPLIKYVYYYLKSKQPELQKKTYGGNLPKLNKDYLWKLEIPIPSKELQKQVVNLLDTFSNLISKLKNELSYRKAQFQYYLDYFYDTCGGNEKSLSQLGVFTRGKRFVHDDAVESDGIPCIHYGELYTYYGAFASEARSQIRKSILDEKKLRYAQKGDVIIVGAGENNEDIGVGVSWEGDYPVAVHDACYTFVSKENPRFISYFLRSSSYHQQIKSYVSEGKICAISSEGIGKAKLRVPKIDIQNEIVSKLDSFYLLINDNQKGLPAEIAARQKQYEYYRDKLLTFKELKA